MSWPPEITVAAIVTRNDTFLMVEEIEHGELVINQPAGHLEPNESLLEAVIREVLEETSYLTRPEAIVGLYQFQAPDAGPLYFRVCYLARVIEKNQSSTRSRYTGGTLANASRNHATQASQPFGHPLPGRLSKRASILARTLRVDLVMSQVCQERNRCQVPL